MTRLERNEQICQKLRMLQYAYENGDFRNFVELLAADCVYESVRASEPPLRGREAVSKHLLGEGKTISESKAFPECYIVELIHAIDPMYETGKPCLIMKEDTDTLLLDVRLNGDGYVERIELCIPELFCYRGCSEPEVMIAPANGEEENKAAAVRIGYPYYEALFLFFHLAGFEFDEYADLEIPMETWVRMLEYWQAFADAPDFDTAFEMLAGVDYAAWSVKDECAQKELGKNGKKLWDGRETDRLMLEGLWEWTEKYRSDHDRIHTYGY